MGLSEASSNMVDIAEDFSLRCDPLHVVNSKLSKDLFPKEINTSKSLANVVNYIKNGINLSASDYSLNPTANIYISVKEFDNGIPLIFDSNNDILESITFLNDDVLDELNDDDNLGLIGKNEIVVARSGAVGKVAWFGKLIEDNPELNFISSGFTTKLCIKNEFDTRFVNLWLNLPFVKYYLIAKSSGKCQRNISQDYIYQIPFPEIKFNKQKKIADKFQPILSRLEKEMLDIKKKGEIVDDVLSELFHLSKIIYDKKAINHSQDDLLNIASRNNFRCDTKQNDLYYTKIVSELRNIPTFELGSLFSSAFIKGKQPNYLTDPEEDGIPIVSTLAIQDISIVNENCRKVSAFEFNLMDENIKPKKGDILLSLDGAVSVGKPAFFNDEDEFGIDSHIGIIRLDKNDISEEIAYLLGSKLCQAQFKLYETGSTSHSISENEIRKILVPDISKNLRSFQTKLRLKLKQKKDEAKNFSNKKTEIIKSFLDEIREALKS